MKNTIDFQIYKFKLNKKEKIIFSIDILLFIVSVFGLMDQWQQLIVEFKWNSYYLWLIIGSVTKFMWDLYSVINEIKGQRNLKFGELHSERIDISQIEASEIEIKNGFKRVACGELKKECKDCRNIKNNYIDYVLQSDDIDKELINNKEIIIKEDNAKQKKIKGIIRSNRDVLLPFLTWQYRISNFYGKQFFNQNKLCLSQDLYSDIKNGTVYCHKGSYYDTFLTNQICGKKLQSIKDDRIISDARPFFPVDIHENKMHMQEITKADMNNEIGVSTIGITNDNYIIFWKQNTKAQSSTGLLVPTGSGSCDWKDLDNSKNFNDTIIAAMKRELWEESGGTNYCKNYKEVGETRIIGFFRWIIKGGKPEFVGITKINENYTKIQANNEEVYNGISKKIDTKESLQKFLESILKENLSTPLYMNIYCLINYLKFESEEKKEEIYKFLLG